MPIAGAPGIWVQYSISHVQDRGIGFGCVFRLGVESKSVNFMEVVKEFRELARVVFIYLGVFSIQYCFCFQLI